MGQKVNPHGLRVGVIKDWSSKWYAEGNFGDLLVEDYNIRKFLKKKLYSAGIAKIDIERASDRVKVIVYTVSYTHLDVYKRQYRKSDFFRPHNAAVFFHFCTEHIGQNRRLKSGGIGIDKEKKRFL